MYFHIFETYKKNKKNNNNNNSPLLEELDFRHNPNICGFAICEEVISSVITQTSGTLHTISAMPVRELLGLTVIEGGGGNIGGNSIDLSSIASMENTGSENGSVSSPKLFDNGSFSNSEKLATNSGGEVAGGDKSIHSFNGNESSIHKRSSVMSKGSKRRSTFKTGTNTGGSSNGGNNNGGGNVGSTVPNGGGGGKLKLDYCDLGPCELVILAAVLRRNALLPKPVS